MNNYLFFGFTVKNYVQNFSFEHKKSKIKEKIMFKTVLLNTFIK